jgi:hypothetical protein
LQRHSYLLGFAALATASLVPQREAERYTPLPKEREAFVRFRHADVRCVMGYFCRRRSDTKYSKQKSNFELFKIDSFGEATLSLARNYWWC